jgi:hypothetical protein
MMGLQGKKILWVGFDSETDGHVVLFDDGSAINITDFVQIEDVRTTATAMLNENILMAKQYVQLEEILNPKVEKPQDEQ